MEGLYLHSNIPEIPALDVPLPIEVAPQVCVEEKENIKPVKTKREDFVIPYQAEKKWIDIGKGTVLARGCILSIVLGLCCRDSLDVKDRVLTTKWCGDCQKTTMMAKTYHNK